jgi:hypothetical protein
MSYEHDKYVCTKETLRKTIDKYGVAIIDNVLDKTECKQISNEVWDYFEHITKEWENPIERKDINTWREFYKLFPLHSMLVQHWNVGQIQASWNVRQNPKVVEIFAHFWNCEQDELLVSFDGLSFHPPPEITNKGWKRTVSYHTDQSFYTHGFKSIQSFITTRNINEYDATLSFLEKSNRYHTEFFEQFNNEEEKIIKDNWVKLSKEQEQFYYDKGCTPKYIKCPKGSLVLWDSRTIHCGVEADKNRIKPNLRIVIYVCYMPKQYSDKKNITKKQKAFIELRTTTHNPCIIKLFAKNPRTYGGKLETISTIDKPILTDLGLSLAGF